jgi:transketolase
MMFKTSSLHTEVDVKNTDLQLAADNIRALSVAMVEKAKSGHPGGAMGAADFMSLLYGEFLRFDPENPHWIARDRFYQDPGHMSPLLYSALAMCGKFTTEELSNFRQLGTVTPGHPELDVERGIENTSGPLGLGHAIAVGSAIAERFLAERFGKIIEHKTYTLISDGGIQEEIAYGAARVAGHLQLSNLIMFYDANDIQLSCATNEVMTQDVGEMYQALGWRVYRVDGHDMDAMRDALTKANAETEKPTLIIGKTIMGKGCLTESGESFEAQISTHGQPVSKAGASAAKTIENLGGDAENPFVIFDDVQKAFADRLDELKQTAAAWKEEKEAWDATEPLKAAKLADWFDEMIPDLDWDEIEHKDNSATRVYSGEILAHFADTVENMICTSADLSNSDNTQKFLDKTGIFKPGDFSGSFLQVGVAELTMASICNGMALHGGVIPVCATFFCFSDFMKPAIRLASLMQLPVKYVWTHDSFRVGEDGPTHQPVEHELQIRLLERMRNLENEPGMLVLRPADSAETTVAWKMALENVHAPTGLILTRQNVKDLPVMGDQTRFEAALESESGGYIISDNGEGDEHRDLFFVANGSDVQLCEDTAELLRKEGKKVRVISVMSPNRLVMENPERLRSLLPEFSPILAVTSGLPLMFQECAGPLGKVFGLRGFGTSAPYTVLEEQFGYTPEKLLETAHDYMNGYAAQLKRMKTHLESLA